MNTNRRNTVVLLASLALSGGVSLAWLAVAGVVPGSLENLLRRTAQLGLAIYLLIFIARPLQQLWRAPLSRWLARNRRLMGIAFAGVMIVHLALILWYRYGVTGEGIQLPTVIAGAVAYLFILAMGVTSWDAPARWLGGSAWRRLHKAGLYWIGLPFIATILSGLREPGASSAYLVFTVLMAVAVGVRIAAWFQRRSRDAGHARVPSA